MTSDFRIVVIQSRWVLAGNYSESNGQITLTDSSVIQRWGTTKGLGQLALQGPQKESVIHPCGTATVPTTAVLYSLAVKREIADKWPG